MTQRKMLAWHHAMMPRQPKRGPWDQKLHYPMVVLAVELEALCGRRGHWSPVFSVLCSPRHAGNSSKLPATHACRPTLGSDCYSLKLTLDTTWSCGEFKHMTCLLNKSLAFIFMRDNSNYSCHDLFLSYSYANDLRLLMRQKLYISYHSSIIKCLSLKSWDINSWFIWFTYFHLH